MALKQNIIYIYFKGKHLVTSKSQYQYNHGQFLYFADLDLPQAFEVHFSSRDRGESKTQIGSDKLVEIPDEYFWNGALQIYAWIYLHSQVNDGETIYEVKIPLIKRAKPTDEEPLPVQQSTIDRAIAELNNAVDITTENANKTDSDKIIVSNIKEDVITLKENIDSTASTVNQKAQETINASERAETSAQNAATSENKALNYSQQAEQSAQSALESKNIAQQKSEVATNASNEALGYRDEALEAKNQAVQAKQNIVDYRDETKGYRDETLNFKNDVQTLKNQIDETAEEIEDISDSVKEDAQSASLSASSASQSANSASQSANQAEQFKNQSEANVTHYPKIIGDYWYVWDATNEEYINTNVDANGIKGDTGNGIESITLNNDYTLTITFTDGTSYTTSSIRGEKGIKGDVGNGITSTVLNNDYTLTLTFTDGTTYTTPSIRGEKGEQGEPATDMDIHICSASEYDSETRVPTIANPDDKTFYLVPTVDGTSPDLFTEWVYVNNAWEMFGSMKIDLSGYLTDVKVDGNSIVTDGVAEIPKANNSTYGIVKINGNYGIGKVVDGSLALKLASEKESKDGTNMYSIIAPINQHISIFYGLAKASGDTTQSQSSNVIGNYTDNAKDKIQTMLGVSPLIAPHESDPFESAHAIGELFIINGKLYRAKTALTAGEYINEGTNVEVVNTSDVYVKNTDYADNGRYGLVKLSTLYGIRNYQGALATKLAGNDTLKRGTDQYDPVVASNANVATFYGLAKASGDITQSQSDNAVGTYTDEAKASIKSMLGIQDGMVVNATLVSGVQYTIDSTYDDIKTALSIGKTVVVISQGIPQPYVGNIQLYDEWYLAFGVSTIYNNVATLTGFMIPQTYQNVAVWTEQNTTIPTLSDVQINGTSIISDGVANIPYAAYNKIGVVQVNASRGTAMSGSTISTFPVDSATVKAGTQAYQPLTPAHQHESVFYGLAKASGDTTQASSSNAVGTYTNEAKTAIKQMLDIHDICDSFIEEVTGTDVTITGQPSYRYNCGEVLSLSITPPSSGTIDIRFTSGSTPTVLTFPSTVKMPEWWVEVEANTIYEMCITDGIYCGVMSWAI